LGRLAAKLAHGVPFIMRWPGVVPAGRVSNEMVHIVDLFTTLARLGGAEIPADWAIDGVDQTAFLLGKSRNWLAIGCLCSSEPICMP
jgi:arylsulfatase A-like enzyme